MSASSILLEKKESKEDTQTWPPGLTRIIQSYISNDIDDKAVALPAVSHSSRLFFFGDENLGLAHTLSYHILWGSDPDPVEDIIMQNLDVLLDRYVIERIDPQGRIQRGTLYQLLLLTDDNHIRNKKGETFLEMMERVFDTMPNGKTIREKQYQAWFRDWDEKAHVTELKTEFDKVTQVFDKPLATMEELQITAETFNTYLSMIRAPKNCIPMLWDYATHFYSWAKSHAYEGDENQKNKFFCRKILGLIDQHLPAWSIQLLKKIREPEWQCGCQGMLRTNIAYYYPAHMNNTVTASASSSSSPALILGDNAFIELVHGCQSIDPAYRVRELAHVNTGRRSSYNFSFQWYIDMQKTLHYCRAKLKP